MLYHHETGNMNLLMGKRLVFMTGQDVKMNDILPGRAVKLVSSVSKPLIQEEMHNERENRSD